jgi:cholesterol transport system auxiliary component
MSAELLARRAFLFAVPVLLAPAACSLVPNRPAAQIYRLSPRMEDPQGHAIPNSKLVVDLPSASKSLDTDRIALTQGRIRFDYYAESVWTDRLPVLLQTLMVESFEVDGRIAEVDRDVYGLTKGYLLRTEIRRFEAQYGERTAGSPEAAVELALRLLVNPDGRLVGDTLISARAQASENKVDAIVIAFDIATSDVLTQSVAWTARVISRDRAHEHHS